MHSESKKKHNLKKTEKTFSHISCANEKTNRGCQKSIVSAEAEEAMLCKGNFYGGATAMVELGTSKIVD